MSPVGCSRWVGSCSLQEVDPRICDWTYALASERVARADYACGVSVSIHFQFKTQAQIQMSQITRTVLRPNSLIVLLSYSKKIEWELGKLMNGYTIISIVRVGFSAVYRCSSMPRRDEEKNKRNREQTVEGVMDR